MIKRILIYIFSILFISLLLSGCDNDGDSEQTTIITHEKYDDARTTMVFYEEECAEDRAFAGGFIFGAEWGVATDRWLNVSGLFKYLIQFHHNF